MSQTLTAKLRGFVAAFTALVLTLALVPVSAFAADFPSNVVGTITITGSNVSTSNTITVYKLADIKVNAYNVTYLDAVSGLDDDLLADWAASGSAADAAELADAADDLASEGTISAVADVSTTSNTGQGGGVVLSSDNFTPGVYYVDIADHDGITHSNIIVSIEPLAENGVWTGGVKSATVSDKSASTTVAKTTLSNNSSGGIYASGDVIVFLVEFSVAEDLDEFYFWDTMTGLTFNNDLKFYSSEPSVVSWSGSNYTVTDGTPITSLTENDDYMLYTNSATHDAAHSHGMGAATFHVDFDDDGAAALYSASDSGTVWVVYSATVTAAAAISNSFNTSVSAGSGGSDNPDAGSGSTLDLSTGIQIFKYDVEKAVTSGGDLDTSATPGLAGAKFTIYTGTVAEVSQGSGTYTFSSLVSVDNALETADGTNGTTLGWGNSATQLFKTGSTYIIEETSAPAGYSLPNSYIVITVGENAKNSTVTVYTYDSTSGYYTVSSTVTVSEETNESSDSYGYTTIAVSNTASDATTDDGSGIGLPTTGGVGTILLTALGVLVMAGAAYLIFRSRRQEG